MLDVAGNDCWPWNDCTVTAPAAPATKRPARARAPVDEAWPVCPWDGVAGVAGVEGLAGVADEGEDDEDWPAGRLPQS